MGLGELISETLNGVFERISENFISKFVPKAVERIKLDVAQQTIDEEQFTTPEMKEYIKNLKENWKHSPENPSDIARDLINIVVGKASAVQLEQIIGKQFSDETPISNNIFNQIAIVTDVTLASNISSVNLLTSLATAVSL